MAKFWTEWPNYGRKYRDGLPWLPRNRKPVIIYKQYNGKVVEKIDEVLYYEKCTRRKIGNSSFRTFVATKRTREMRKFERHFIDRELRL